MSPKTATVFGDCRRFRRQIVAEIGDYSRQCGQTFSMQVVKQTVMSIGL